MSLILRSIFYYLNESILFEKHFEDKRKVRNCFILVFVVSLISNLVLQHISQVFADDVSVQKINVIISNIMVNFEQNDIAGVNQIFAAIEPHSKQIIEYFIGFVSNNYLMIIIAVVLPAIAFITSTLAVIKYLINLVIAFRRKKIEDTRVKTYYNDEYPETEAELSSKFKKNFFKYLLLVLCIYLFLNMVSGGVTIMSSLLEIIFTRVLYFTVLFNVCFNFKFTQSFAKGIRVFGFGFFKMTVNMLIFTLLAQIIQTVVYNFGVSLGYKEAVVVLGSFAASLLTFMEAKFYFLTFADTYCGIPKIEEETE